MELLITDTEYSAHIISEIDMSIFAFVVICITHLLNTVQTDEEKKRKRWKEILVLIYCGHSSNVYQSVANVSDDSCVPLALISITV